MIRNSHKLLVKNKIKYLVYQIMKNSSQKYLKNKIVNFVPINNSIEERFKVIGEAEDEGQTCFKMYPCLA